MPGPGDQCPREHCGGQLYLDNGDLKCRLCARTQPLDLPPVPQRSGSVYQRHQYYEDHRKDITKDFFEIGEKPMLKRWKIPLATWACAMDEHGNPTQGLLVRWGLHRPDTAQNAGQPPDKVKKSGVKEAVKTAMTDSVAAEVDAVSQNIDRELIFLRGVWWAVNCIFGSGKGLEVVAGSEKESDGNRR